MKKNLIFFVPFITITGTTAQECPKALPFCVSRASAGREYHCGARGSIDANPRNVKAKCSKSLKDCRNICFTDSKCKTFQFDPGTALCKLYDSSVRGSNFKRDSQDAKLFDIKCFSYAPLNTSNLLFRSITGGEDEGMFPAFADRGSESVVILGSRGNASTFAIDPSSGALSTSNGTGTVIANQNNAKFGQELYFNTADVIDEAGYREAVCSISSDLYLNCTTGHRRHVMFDDGGVVALASPKDAAGYPSLTLKAICST